MEKITKMITRDFSLFITQWWRDVLRDTFIKSIGVGYNDMVGVHDGLSLAYYYALQDLEDLKLALIAKLKKEPDFYYQQAAVYRLDVEKTRGVLKKLATKKKLEVKTVGLLKERFTLLNPCLRLSVLIPAILAQDLKNALGTAGEKIIAAAYKDRVDTEGVFEEIDALLIKLAGESLKQFGYSPKLAKFLTVAELELLANGKQVNWKDLTERSKGFVYCKGKVYLTHDYQDAFTQNDYLYEEEKPHGNSIKGTVASAGKTIRGRVKKLFVVEQVRDFPEGAVLVTPMTVPDFIPAMNRAIAIVTDEGGVTCHAAIVSREMKKPCVIGTRFATTLFNDGDEIEVNSETGVVTKL